MIELVNSEDKFEPKLVQVKFNEIIGVLNEVAANFDRLSGDSQEPIAIGFTIGDLIKLRAHLNRECINLTELCKKDPDVMLEIKACPDCKGN